MTDPWARIKPNKRFPYSENENLNHDFYWYVEQKNNNNNKLQIANRKNHIYYTYLLFYTLTLFIIDSRIRILFNTVYYYIFYGISSNSPRIIRHFA